MVNETLLKKEFNNLPKEIQIAITDAAEEGDADAIYDALKGQHGNISSRFFGDFLRYCQELDPDIKFNSKHLFRVTFPGSYPPNQLMLNISSTSYDLVFACEIIELTDELQLIAMFTIQDALKVTKMMKVPEWHYITRLPEKSGLTTYHLDNGIDCYVRFPGNV